MNRWCRERESGELRSRSDNLEEDQRLNAGDKQLLKRVLKENEILKAKLAPRLPTTFSESFRALGRDGQERGGLVSAPVPAYAAGDHGAPF
jgi:hypothetical protein